MTMTRPLSTALALALLAAAACAPRPGRRATGLDAGAVELVRVAAEAAPAERPRAGGGIATAAPADPPPTVGVGEVYGDDIATVQFGIAGLELAPPIVELGGAARLLLTFDVLDPEVRQYRYDLTHCDRDWQRSQLSEIEYLSTFTEGDITEFDLSFNAVTQYVHYQLTLPNQYVQYTKSGNYLLNVYDDVTGELVMRQRFCVVEPLAEVLVDQTRPAQVALDRTHQEFDVGVSVDAGRFENPRRTMSLTAMQNGDWRTAIYGLEPRFVRGEVLSWDYQNVLVWPASREWRALDLRTIETQGGRVAELTREGDEFTALLYADESRATYPPETRIDLNGKFVIEDFDNRLDLQAEYVRAVFSLKAPRHPADRPVYLYGALTHYAFGEANRGVYNELTNSYLFDATLKQGFHNYAFVTPGEDGVRPVWADYEGNWFQTENEYQFLLYYRPYGARFDRLVGFASVQVNRP